MTWDHDALEFGHVVARPLEGGWWHLHFGRQASYWCELLGRPTEVVACLQWFAAGAVTRSLRFVLTLDGEGVELPPDGPPVDFAWVYAADSSEAAHFQRSVVPLLYDSSAFQSAVAAVVSSQRHLRVADAWKFC